MHCEGWDHTELSVTTHQSYDSGVQDREITSLSLLLTKNHMVLVLKVTHSYLFIPGIIVTSVCV